MTTPEDIAAEDRASWKAALDQAVLDLAAVKLDNNYGGMTRRVFANMSDTVGRPWTHDEHIADAQQLVDQLTAQMEATSPAGVDQ